LRLDSKAILKKSFLGPRYFQTIEGGWVASEAFEYLLGAPEIDEYLRYELWPIAVLNDVVEHRASLTTPISRRIFSHRWCGDVVMVAAAGTLP
jgi:hypothetical protein